MTCTYCTYARVHGGWPASLGTQFHCRECHVTTPGSNKWGHCRGCCLTFAGDNAFSRHQMVTGCPDTIEGVETSLRETSARMRGHKKRHLVEKVHPEMGYSFWAWNGTPIEHTKETQ